jgi:hypothetical protein
MVSQNQRLFDTFKNYVVGDSWSMSDFDPQSNDDIELMFQTGYLTIKGKEKNADSITSYKLGFLNQEVEHSFAKYLLAEYITVAPERLTNDLSYPMKKALNEADLETFTNCIKVTFFKNTASFIYRKRSVLSFHVTDVDDGFGYYNAE